MDQTNLGELYGLEPIPWSRALEALEVADARNQTHFLATTRPDGRPHVAAIGALWVDGTFYFTSGAGTRKSRNLAENPNCVISVSLTGIDLVVEGTAAKVTDDETSRAAPPYARISARCRSRCWPSSSGHSVRPRAGLNRPGESGDSVW